MTTNTITIEATKATPQLVSQLRKEGKLHEAFSMATALLEIEPDNIWNRRAMAWVGLEFLKIIPVYGEEIVQWIDRLQQLNIPLDDEVFWVQFRWRGGKILFNFTEFRNCDLGWLKSFLDCLPKQASEAHSYVLRAILKHAASLPNLPFVIEAWGWEYFTVADMASQILPNGKKVPALAERAYVAVAKVYMEQQGFSSLELSAFADRLEKLSSGNSEWLYVIYYRAMLLQKIGEEAAARQAIIPFARRKPNEFWVWDLLGSLHQDDKLLQKACYARGLSCKGSDDFVLKLRQKLAMVLIAENKWAEARYEIDALYKTRIQNNWRIPAEVIDWMRDSRYLQATILRNNGELYTSLRSHAEGLLLDERARHNAVIWKVNPERKTASFFVNDQVHGGFGYSNFNMELEVGMPVIIYLEKKKGVDGDYFKVNHIQSSSEASENHVRAFEGKLRIAGSIGFVNDNMIGPELMIEASRSSNCKGKSVKTFDQKRGTWGWKAFCLDR